MNPFELYSNTIFDFDVFIERISSDITKDNEDMNKGGNESVVIKSLRYTRNILNNLELG